MITPDFARDHFSRALPYDAYTATGTPDQQANWQNVHASVRLTDAQHALITSFTRRLHVLATSGMWCGDCAHQVPMLDHIARANPLIELRLADRDKHMQLAELVRICGGIRVPTVLFFNEDFEFLGLSGDKTLNRLRASAQRKLGAACAVPGAPLGDSEAAATMQDWVNDFERSHLLARLSPRLRERHAD
jgi:hypothetical protein